MSDDFSDLFQEFDPDVVAEFMDELRDAYAEIEELLLRLERSPDERPLVDDLFRRVHSIKSNLRMVGFDAHAEFVHAVEEVLDAVRYDQLSFDKRVSDVVLLSVDRVHAMAEGTFAGQETDAGVTGRVQQALVRIARGDTGAIGEAVVLLDPDRADVDEAAQRRDDLRFFAALAHLLEQRSPYWNGRYGRVLDLAAEMNREAGEAVDPQQLEAAVYLHDLGMAFLPLDILHKPESLSAAEQGRLAAHPGMAADLLAGMPAWEEAARIVRHHHEYADGSGYPAALASAEVAPGAMILAIADTFEAVTHERADHHPRPLLRAITEINSGAGKQFDVRWVEVFNRVIRRKRVRK